jgi:hypothetical protein
VPSPHQENSILFSIPAPPQAPFLLRGPSTSPRDRENRHLQQQGQDNASTGTSSNFNSRSALVLKQSIVANVEGSVDHFRSVKKQVIERHLRELSNLS